MAAFVVPLAAVVVTRGYRVHGRRPVLAAALVGCACIVAGSVLPFVDEPSAATADPGCAGDCCPQLVTDEHGDTSVRWSTASLVTLLGSGLLVAGHVGNLTCTRRCCRE